MPAARPLNPKTNKPWTVDTLLSALARANEIANAAANNHDLCEVWESIMDEIVEDTGLPFVGRPRQHYLSITLDISWETVGWSEEEFRLQVLDAISSLGPVREVEFNGAVRHEY